MPSGWRGAPCFRRHGRELVSKPVFSLKKSWGGYRRTNQNYNTRRVHDAVVHNSLERLGRAGRAHPLVI